MFTSTRCNKILLFLLFGFVFSHPIYADMTADEVTQLISILKDHGTDVKTISAFFLSGEDCYNHQLNKISYLKQNFSYYLYFNDSLGNCIFATLVTAPLPKTNPPMQPGNICTISTSVYQQTYTSWNLDAIKSFDQTRKMNPVAQQFIASFSNCLVPSSSDAVMSILKSSEQMISK